MAGLREDGYIIRINHIRYFEYVTLDSGNNQESEAFQLYFQLYMTRGEFQKGLEEGKVLYCEEDFPEGPPRYCDVVSPIGGWTRVTIEKEGVVVTFGKKNFRKNENFFRKKGVDGAFKMAYNALCQTLTDGATAMSATDSQ